MRFSVPMLPPSVNHYKQMRRGGGMYLTKQATAFADQTFLLSRGIMITGNFYEIDLTFYLGPKRQKLSSHDLDNFIKVAIDALARAHVITNDGRVLDLHVHKRFCSTERDERTEFSVEGKQIDERALFQQGELPAPSR